MSKYLILLTAVFLLTLGCKTSEKTSDGAKASNKNHSYRKDDHQRNEEPPQLIGGPIALNSRVVYPEEARKKGVHGTVVIGFVVTKKGKATHFRVLKSVGSGCDMAAISALKRVHFKPGKINGKPVNVRFRWPVRFQLQ